MSSLRLRKRPGSGGGEDVMDSSGKYKLVQESQRRVSENVGVVSLAAMIGLLVIVHCVQNVWLPKPLSAEEAGSRGFSEERAFAHLHILTSFGPKPVGSENLEHALEYISGTLENIKEKANPNVYMEIENFHSKQGVNRLKGGMFKGKTLAYADLNHVLVRLSSKFSPDAEDNAVLVSSHVDTVYTSHGGGDCGSCVSVMLELVRALSQVAQHSKHSVIFLFNTGEEDGLDGAHSFITQHPWNSSVKTFVDLEAMGAGGRSTLFQAGPNKWPVDVFARTATRPAANILAQDVFHAGIFKSATDFQVYREVGGLSGLDFAYTENGATYHTPNDAIGLVRAGSLQHLGDNMLPFLIEAASSHELANLKPNTEENTMQMFYFDILGRYMVTFSRDFSRVFYASILVQSLLLFAGSLVRAEIFSVTALASAVLGVFLTWTFSLSFAAGVAALVPIVSPHAVPYIAHPLLAVGLFGSSALLGAITGHFIGHEVLRKLLFRSLQSAAQVDAEAEKFMYKAVFLQWLLILGLGLLSGAGSTYIAVVWLIPPAIAYGLKESALSKNQHSQRLSSWTLLFGLPLPLVLSADMFLNLPQALIGNLVRLDRNPGGVSPWMANAVIAALVAVIVCLSVSYVLPYIHRRGGRFWILLVTTVVLLSSLYGVAYELLPAFTKQVGKGTYVVHVVESNTSTSTPQSYVSVSFTTPGGPEKEVDSLVQSGFICGDTKQPDFVSFKVVRGCTKPAALDDMLMNAQPKITRLGDRVVDEEKMTSIGLDSKQSHRWTFAVDAAKVKAFQVDILTETGAREALVPKEIILEKDEWHTLQFASGRGGPRHFNIELTWRKGSVETSPVLKFRADMNFLTKDAASAQSLLPESCVLFGKSTSPCTLAFLINM